MNAQQTAISKHWDRMVKHAGIALRFRRGVTSVDLTGVPGQTPVEAMDTQGFTTTVTKRNFLIKSAALVLDGKVAEPKDGDFIDELSAAGGDVVRTHQVMAPLPGAPAWRYSDPGRKVIRVHTAQVSVN